MKRKQKHPITLPEGKDGDLAITQTLRLKAKIEALGGIPNHPQPWEDDIVIYNNSLINQLEDLEKKRGQK